MAIKYEINRELLDERIRIKVELTQNFCKLGITKQSLSNKLNAKSISIASLVDIANALGISNKRFKDYFFTWIQKMSYTRKQFKSELDWLGGRIIGGSGASAIVGENPYKTNVQYFNNMMKIKKGYQVKDTISNEEAGYVWKESRKSYSIYLRTN